MDASLSKHLRRKKEIKARNKQNKKLAKEKRKAKAELESVNAHAEEGVQQAITALKVRK